MIILYQGTGAGDFYPLDTKMPSEQIRLLKHNVSKLLEARGNARASKLLNSFPFEILESSNFFGDDFYILQATLPLKSYEQVRKINENNSDRLAFRQIAETFGEIGTYVRFIAADLQLETETQKLTKGENLSKGLSSLEIQKLVYKYIGVEGGYLGDFSYQTHHEFYIQLDLDINPYKYEGTTRQHFTKILSESRPEVQAKILEGILNRYPVGSSELRTQEKYDEILRWISVLRGITPVECPTPHITSEVVNRALADAEQLLRSTGATSAVDRSHTALHGYLQTVCAQSGITYNPDASLNELIKLLQKNHPSFKDLGPRKDDINRIFRLKKQRLCL